jgi:AcrR family transcriptional regulator
VIDRRARRHAATRQEILDATWELARERGLMGWSLREVAEAVGMRAPSLYGYFASKDAIYDAMFAQGNEQLLAAFDDASLSDDPLERLRQIAHGFFGFYVSDPARHQLLFLRVIPDFVPSEGSYAVARRALDRLHEALAEIGIDRQESVDLWTALLAGLASQQASNDPGGDRWARLIDRSVEIFFASESPAHR